MGHVALNLTCARWRSGQALCLSDSVVCEEGVERKRVSVRLLRLVCVVVFRSFVVSS